MKEKIFNRLSFFMEKHNYNDTSLSKKIKVNRKSIGKIRRCEVEYIKFDILLKFCKVFKIKLEDILYIGEDYGN